jgi:beta-galactosidase
MEGKEIAVWVYSNLDQVELLVNGKSLGGKDVKKDSHVAWNVTYAPGNIEARGYKDGRVVMTEKRETTGPAAKLVMTADRREIAADGEDVAMFAVAVQDAEGRVVPITDNEVSFKISGGGRLIGVGNGDPTDHESDKGTSRKAFSGWCMAIVQATKTSGEITVEATSPGLAPATVTIAAKGVTLRPQVAVWERDVPVGSGVTGLWRPMPYAGSDPTLKELLARVGPVIFTLRQEGTSLRGSVEGANRSFSGGNDVPAPITEGKVDGDRISFKAAGGSYSGTVKGDRIELERAVERRPSNTSSEPKDGLAVGPPPDGTDPSRDPTFHPPSSVPVVLHRVQR